MSDMPRKTALSLRGLTGGWGPTTIVEDISLSVDPGETVAILGRNGVGKSTLLELVVGRASRRGGDIVVSGENVTRAPAHRRVRRGLGYVPQAREIFKSLSVREHLDVAARPGRWDEERIFELFPSLRNRRDSLAGYLSGGEQQMLAIARALITNPRILLMDEPSEGLAPLVVDHLVMAVRTIVSAGDLAVVLVEQRSDIALDLSTRCLIMDRGRIVHQGDSAALKRDGEERLLQLMGLDHPLARVR